MNVWELKGSKLVVWSPADKQAILKGKLAQKLLYTDVFSQILFDKTTL